jgi:hypothetical protein
MQPLSAPKSDFLLFPYLRKLECNPRAVFTHETGYFGDYASLGAVCRRFLLITTRTISDFKMIDCGGNAISTAWTLLILSWNFGGYRCRRSSFGYDGRIGSLKQ